MYRTVLIGGVAAAVIVGAGTAALALGDPSAPTTPSSHARVPAGKNGGKHSDRRPGRMLRRVVHGEIVTVGPGGFVTHQVIRGDVTDVSAHSITVKAMDDTSETFTVTADTVVRARANGRGRDAAISDVRDGDQVLVAGTGSADAATARRVIDLPH